MENLSLILNLASDIGSAAIVSFEDSKPKVIGRMVVSDRFSHSEKLLGNLDSLLKSHKLTLKEFTLFIGPLGPGSFTGLRVGLMTLKAFAFSSDSQISLINLVEAKAFSYLSKSSEKDLKEILVITPVSQRKYLLSTFLVNENKLEKTDEKTVESLSEITNKSNSVILASHKIFKDQTVGFNYIETNDLTAAEIGRVFERLTEKITASNINEKQLLSPTYFGTRF